MADLCELAWRTLQAVVPALPRVEELGEVLEEAEAAQGRGYYEPDEDERLREVYRRYLGVRVSLWQMVMDLRPMLDEKNQPDERERCQVFGLAFCAAAMLVRSASYIVELARERPVVRKKLDEAEPRFAIEGGSFSRVYGSLSSTRWMWRYFEAWKFYEENRERIGEVLREEGMGKVAEWLRAEEPFMERRRRDFLKRKWRYGWHAWKGRHVSGYKKVMFGLLKLGGSTVAEMRQPLVKRVAFGKKGKRVDAGARESVAELLCAGDVLVTRHDDAMSNLFLPGFWPHAAFYIGRAKQREGLGVGYLLGCGQADSVLEAKKDGVLYRQLEETLRVDAFVVLRPRLAREYIKEAVERAVSHEGKLYDFVFDFRKSDRLVCTEVVYRAYHGVGGVEFRLTKRSGRLALSAEDLMRQGIEGGFFEVVACFGVGDDLLRVGESAKSRVMASLRKLGGG